MRSHTHTVHFLLKQTPSEPWPLGGQVSHFLYYVHINQYRLTWRRGLPSFHLSPTHTPSSTLHPQHPSLIYHFPSLLHLSAPECHQSPSSSIYRLLSVHFTAQPSLLLHDCLGPWHPFDSGRGGDHKKL